MAEQESGPGGRPIRVRWLIKGLGPGGAETLLVSTARLLDTERFDVEVDYLLPWKEHLVEPLQEAGATVRCLGVSSPTDPRWIARFVRGLRSVDVVHVHSPLPASLVRPLLRAMPHRPAVVTTEHNVWRSFTQATRLANRLTAPLDDVTLAVSGEVQSSMTPSAAARAEVLVHGVDLDQIRAAAAERAAVRAELGVEADRKLVVTVANLRADKAYPDLLSAARRVLDADPSVVFVAVGQGPLEDELHRLHGELGLGERFRFLGYRPDAFRYTAAADVFALASHHEGYPIAVMEAMAAGVPVVVTNVGGMAEAVRDRIDGRKVAPERPDEFAAALGGVLTDDERRRVMGASARERAEMFDMRRAVARLEELYLELDGRRR